MIMRYIDISETAYLLKIGKDSMHPIPAVVVWKFQQTVLSRSYKRFTQIPAGINVSLNMLKN